MTLIIDTYLEAFCKSLSLTHAAENKQGHVIISRDGVTPGMLSTICTKVLRTAKSPGPIFSIKEYS